MRFFLQRIGFLLVLVVCCGWSSIVYAQQSSAPSLETPVGEDSSQKGDSNDIAEPTSPPPAEIEETAAKEPSTSSGDDAPNAPESSDELQAAEAPSETPQATTSPSEDVEQMEAADEAQGDAVNVKSADAVENSASKKQMSETEANKPIGASSPAANVEKAPFPNRSSPRKNMWLFGGGGTFGIIYPKEVNQYIESWLNAQGDYTTTEDGFTEMVLALVPNLSLLYSPIEYVNFELFTEFSWAPKILSVQNGESNIFHFIRFSPGLNVLCNIPFNSYKNSIFFGGGVEFDLMRFEDFVGKSLGVRAKAGLRLYMPKRTLDVFGAVLVTKDESNMVSDQHIELNYTTVMFGTTVYLNISGV